MSVENKSCEISIVIPCLNEEASLGICVKKALAWIQKKGIQGEVVVADNGSTDRSCEIAEQLGARVVHVAEKGYGNALDGGIHAAYGEYVVMGDADDSYDFTDLTPFLEKLREGYDLVQGCRLPSGGGKVMPGAMPFLHYYFGNPFFSFLVRWWFSLNIHDIYCGLRGFRKEMFEQLNMRCTGMEFATEMVIKARLFRYKIAEVPITLHPDKRGGRRPHLRTFRDGWRTLCFYLTCNPRWLFFFPGYTAFFWGVVGYIIVEFNVVIAGIHFDVHTLLMATLLLVFGYQYMYFYLFAKVFAENEKLLPPDPRVTKFFNFLTHERFMLLGGISILAGVGLWGWAFMNWWHAHFGPLNYSTNMRLAVPGVALITLGCQTILGSFMLCILRLRRK